MTVGALATGCLDRPLAPAAPHTSNIFVDQIKQTAIDKIDLLFMIDNSISMADKQAILAKAVPGLLQRLINPVCVSTSNPALSQPGPGPTAPCPDGYKKEFSPINDIHIGVISSSLGSHGGQYCDEKVEVQIPMPPHLNPMLNDRAYLLGKVRPGLYSFNNTGFLAWEPSDTTLSAHERDSATMSNDFTSMVTSAGETGCGYEAQLEAWYRFLVEPFPPQSVTLNTMTNQAELSTCTETDKSGCDNELLAQRASFLRVDSL
ncbi:MAG TPA: hypothetical protein VGJ84_07840, partial [Polyangiaceae bacterium]